MLYDHPLSDWRWHFVLWWNLQCRFFVKFWRKNTNNFSAIYCHVQPFIQIWINHCLQSVRIHYTSFIRTVCMAALSSVSSFPFSLAWVLYIILQQMKQLDSPKTIINIEQKYDLRTSNVSEKEDKNEQRASKKNCIIQCMTYNVSLSTQICNIIRRLWTTATHPWTHSPKCKHQYLRVTIKKNIIRTSYTRILV